MSKWLIRLRRFASNELDIVKVVVSNISQSVRNWSPNQLPVLRYITFKNLEPSSAYEICVESASPNQQVGDKFQILDANHFLKCHDSSDVELHNITLPSLSATASNSSLFRRMDIRHLSEEVSANESDIKDQDKMNSFQSNGKRKRKKRATGDHHHHHHQSGHEEKMKSLCKEFFTLPADSLGKINFGQTDIGRVQTLSGNRGSVKTTDPLYGSDEAQQFASNTSSQMSSLRKPKSLNNKALRSHMELLEINDLSAPDHATSMFEITASSPSLNNNNNNNNSPQAIPSGAGNRLSSIASDNTNYIARDFGPHLKERGLERPGPNAHRLDYLSQSVIPIVGCVFGFIFIITLANILLNAISCKSSQSSSPPNGHPKSRTRKRRDQHNGAILDHRAGGHTLNSFYSDYSDNSNTSQSRIVVVGKNGEPFAATSAYFEVPVERSRPNEHLSLELTSSSGNSSREKHSSSYLLSADQARFPLGPSFEGDEKHNADMVGLARKNYDNFINHIYNGETSKELEGEQSFNEKRTSHHHYHHHHHRVNGGSQYANRQQQSLLDNDANEGTSKSTSDLNKDIESERYARAKKQRIRFDKINPIYNMDGLYATNTRQLSRRKAQLGQVSSFGHSNPALVMEEEDERRNKQLSGGEKACNVEQPEEQCSFCDQTNEQQQQQQVASDSSLVVGCDLENCENSSYFTCCLDKQKQRFQKQQQQLEKVLTKNGSLVPQPFINPSGPPRCASPTCESVVREHEQLSTEPANDLSELEMSSNVTSKVQESVIGDSMSQHDRSEQEMIQLKGDQKADLNNQEKRTFFMFGEIPTPPPLPPNQTSGSSKSVAASSSSKKPPAPTSPDFGTRTIPKDANDKPVVNVGSMGTNLSDHAKGAHETINKTDFDQRRNELASKLQLKPG